MARYIAPVLALVLAVPVSAQQLDPVAARFERVRLEIYDAAQWLRRVPYDLAVPLVARSRLRSFVTDLPLDGAVRARVIARIESRGFVDEIVPFLMSVKDMYAASSNTVKFDAHLRAMYHAAEPIPGMEHSMFQWEEAASAAGPGGLGLDSELASELVRFYDALYLQDGAPGAALGDQLACEQRSGRAEAIERALPIVRRLLELAGGRIELDPGFAAGMRAILADDHRLETVTISLLEFIDQLVCRHYRVFATRVFREQQLRQWMLREFADGGAELFDWLAYAQERRHAALVVVDGLQGHLVEALAGGPETAVFLARIRDEQRAGGPRVPDSLPAPAQRTEFLEAIAEYGWPDPRFLPFFRDLYAHTGSADALTPAGVARVGVASTPTISVRNLPIAWAGAPVAGEGSTGIPNFHFVDRTYRKDGAVVGRPYYFYGNDALQLGRLAAESGMRSLFDRLQNYGSMACGAQYDDAAHYSIDALLNLGLGERLRDFGEAMCVGELDRRAENERQLRTLRAELLDRREALTASLPWYRVDQRAGQRDLRAVARRRIARIAALEQETLPELLVHYNPWPDHFAHFTGPFSDEILAPSGELARLDYWLGRIRAAYAAGGADERLLMGLVGDHGLTPVFSLLNPEVRVFDALRAKGVDFRVVKISSDEGEGPKLNHPFDPPVMKGIDVVVASTAGGNYMLDLFKDQGAGWSEQPLHSDLISMATLAKPGKGIDVVEELQRRLRDSLDYLVVREEPCDVQGGQVRLVGARDGRRADAWITRRGARIHYRFQGADLLEMDRASPYRAASAADRAEHARLLARCVVDAKRDEPSTWCDDATWRLLTSYTPRPDSVAQLAHLYDHPRAGTINLFPRAGVGYNSIVPGRHAGEHFHEKDALVAVFGAPLAGPARPRLRTAVNGSVAVTLFEYLTGSAVTPGRDGWGYPSLRRQVAPAAQ